MNKLLPAGITILVLGLAAHLVPFAGAQMAPGLSLSPATVTVQQNNSFSDTVTVSTGSYAAQVSDVTIQYAANDFDVSVAAGSFFPSFASAVDKTAGLIELHGYTTTPDGISGTGTLATLTFKAKKGSGSSTITFICSGSGHDSNILTTSGINVLNCAQKNQAAVNYTGATNPASTPTPTPPHGVTPTATPTPTPVPGNNTYPVCASLSSNVTNAVGAPLPVTFSCTGVDTDGYVSAAHFDFGDGTTDTIVQNAGSPGTITTTHTYTTIGSLGVSCSVRDNNNVWSSSPDNCRKIIKIQPRPQTASTTTRTVTQNDNSTIQYVVENTPTPTPTPMEQVVTIVDITPTPEQTPVLTPTPTNPPVQSASGTGIGWAILAVAVIGVGFLIYRKNSGNNTAPPPTTPPPLQ
jgi:hypothetical protein